MAIAEMRQVYDRAGLLEKEPARKPYRRFEKRCKAAVPTVGMIGCPTAVEATGLG
jgi:hypothetical protein